MGMDTISDNTPMEKQAPLSGLNPVDLLKQGAAEDTFADGASGGFHPPAIGEIASAFPQLEILELIGQGGMGAVYKVRQKELDRIVALKILPPAIGQSPESSRRFTREARALAKLNHPGIVTIHEFGQQNGLFFILMEFVDGVNLAQLMKTGRVSPREALAIVPQICDALQYAHDQGIVHRDIKPENLLLNQMGRVKVADFGIAKIVAAVRDPMGGEATPADESQTLAGRVIGTPQYMAPEQLEHPTDVDHRADIYALGVVFYQMLTGELPGKDLQTPSRKVTIDVRLDEMVLRALEEKPERRYQTALEFRTALDGLPSATPSPPVPKRGMIRRWWWVFLVMIPLGLLLGLLSAWLVTYVLPKKYEAQAIIEVIPANGKLITPTFYATQFEAIKSRAALAAVSRELELADKWMTDEETAVSILNGIIIIENIRGTDLILIRVRHTNRQDTATIANAVALNYQQSISGKVVIHDRAMEPTIPASPNVGVILFSGGLLGLVLSPLLTLISMMVLQRIFPDKGAEAHASKPGRIGRLVAIVCGVLALGGFLVVGLGAFLLIIRYRNMQSQQGLLAVQEREIAKAALLAEQTGEPPGNMLSEYDWKDLAKEGRVAHGVVEAADGRTVLKIENLKSASMQARLLTIEKPPVKAMRYAVSGEIRYENVQGHAYMEMWSVFPEGRYFSRTLETSGQLSQLTGTSGWREFTLPFDRSGTADAPIRIEVNLRLPGRGVVFVGPLELIELGAAQAVLDRAGSHGQTRNEKGTPKEDVVAGAVETWLSHVDATDYDKSWNEASGFFRKSITTEGWSDVMMKFRKPLGAVKSRTTRDMKEADTLPGAPDGKYCIIQFDTSFAEKAEAVETVTFMLEKDGTWKAAGYFIQ